MKRLGIGLSVVSILALAAVISVSGVRDGGPLGRNVGEGLAVETAAANPWTHLKINNRAGDFQFAIVTDRTGGHRPGVFSKAVGKINLLQPEFVTSVGDLIEGGSEDPGQWALEWAEFEAQVDALQMPFFFCPGNHDITNVPMSDEWRRKFGRSYYHFRYRDVLFLVLNSEEPRGEKVPYLFSAAQQQWAADVLARNSDVRWTFVFFHKPIWTYTDSDPASLGWTAIENALQGRQYTVFSGHKHEYGRFIRKGHEYYMLATTGGSSKLRGLDYGEFDHFVWVTMKPEGPVIANVLLDGIEDRAIRTLPDPMPR
ncbi:MAG: metallophosphoesterase [Pirellulales bacterium]